MNYTGRPSISGCRPVLSLYPTHRFCQYLLLIFITFTNSVLFNRAFSTNSRKRSGNNLSVTADAVPLPGCALSGAPRQLPQRGGFGIPQSFPSQFKVFLSARGSPTRGGFGSPRRVNGFARGSPTRGAVERSETERLYEDGA